MSSLLSQASTWQSDDNIPIPKKRISTLRRPQSQSQSHTLQPSQTLQNSIYEYGSPPQPPQEQTQQQTPIDNIYNKFNTTADDLQEQNAKRASRIDELISKITDNDGGADNQLCDFKPLEHPSVQVKNDLENQPIPKYNPSIASFATSSVKQKQLNDTNYGNYSYTYTAPSQTTTQTAGQDVVIDTKLLEKINYLIFMMEQQKNEKTNNITEEFILYIFLGIFIIYVIDSFARVGKYTR